MTNVTSSYRNYRYVRLVCWLVFGFLVWSLDTALFISLIF